MSPERRAPLALLRLAAVASLAFRWPAMEGQLLLRPTAVLAVLDRVVLPRPPQLRQAVTLVSIIAGTGVAAFAVAVAFADRLLMLMAGLGLLFFLGFLMRDRAGGRRSLPATMLLNATAVVPVLTVQAEVLGAGVLGTLVLA